MTIEICGSTHADASKALGYLKARGLSQVQVAGLLGVGKAYVTDVKNGRKPWQEEWGARLTTILEANGDAVPKVDPGPPLERKTKPIASTSKSDLETLDAKRRGAARYTFEKDGLCLPDDLTQEEWTEAAEMVRKAEQATQWWIGDLWNAISWGAKSLEMSALGFNPDTPKRYGTVCETFPYAERLHLPFAHHQMLASREDAADLLAKAEKEGLSAAKLREAIRETDGEEKPQSAKEKMAEVQERHGKEIATYKAKLKELEETVDMMDPEPPADSIAAMKATWEASTKKLQSRCTALEKENARLNASVEALHKETGDQHEDISTLEDENAELKARIAELTSDA